MAYSETTLIVFEERRRTARRDQSYCGEEMTHSGAWSKKCLEVFRRLAKSPGKMRQAERHAGVGEGYLRKAMHQGRAVNLERFFQLLEGLGLEPGPFFSYVFPSTGSSELGSMLDLPNGPEPSIVRLARQRWDDDERGISQRSHLLELDDLRYDDPAQVSRFVEDVVRHALPSELPLALGIYASSCRPRARYDAAWHALRAAFEFLDQRDDVLARADLLQRMAFLIAEQRDFERALETTNRATLLYAQAGEVGLMSHTLVDRGTFLGNCGRHEKAREVFIASLGLLPSTSRRHRLAATLGIGTIELFQGLPEKAMFYAMQAQSLASSRLERGKAAWTLACAAVELERWEDAEQGFEEALNAFLIAAPLDAALSVCDHVHALLAQGRFGEAHERSLQMRRLLVPLEEHDSIAAAAARDLIVAEHQGERRLTSMLVVEVREVLEKSRRAVAHRHGRV